MRNQRYSSKLCIEVRQPGVSCSVLNGQNKPRHSAGFSVVRPAWAHSCGWKSRHELVTASEVKR
ncbi:hypothetical protein GOA99_32255, partial [Sinorhizobium meliloti]|nr:hypothetical protein [Sinorhizobium meliloti]